jgi:hypothetical protein
VGLTPLVDVRLSAELTAEIAVTLGVIAFVGEHGADTGHDREGRQEQALEDNRVVHVGRSGGAGHGHAVPIHSFGIMTGGVAFIGFVAFADRRGDEPPRLIGPISFQ